MNRSVYFNFIEERLNVLATRIEARGRLNVLDLHTHSEDFYLHFLNLPYSWSLVNENEKNVNIEAIDLIDNKNHLIIQVSSTATKQKIETALAKELLKLYSEYTFKFVSIARDAEKLRKTEFKNPFQILFNPKEDIIDKNSILKKVKGLEIVELKKIYDFINKELVSEFNPVRLDSNLTTIINILASENLSNNELVIETNTFEIDKKINYNDLNYAKPIIADYSMHYSRLDRIYSEYDLQGSNKSNSVLASIRDIYIKSRREFNGDDLFFEIRSKVQERIINSSNYSPIPIEELEQCINIVVVDTFIRCKIFENPEDYNYVIT